MIDSIQKGTGNSRKLKSAIAGTTTWEQAREMLVNGTLPIDLGRINPDGWQTVGTPLNQNTLLWDKTAQRLRSMYPIFNYKFDVARNTWEYVAWPQLNGMHIWIDDTFVHDPEYEIAYCSAGNAQDVFERSGDNFEWKPFNFIYTGVSKANLFGVSIFNDGQNVFYTAGTGTECMLIDTEWSSIQWIITGNAPPDGIIGNDVWKWNNQVYYSEGGSVHLKHRGITSQDNTYWDAMSWGGQTAGLRGRYVWDDGTYVYCSVPLGVQIVLDPATNTWNNKVWTGLDASGLDGQYVWKSGNSVFYTKNGVTYELDYTTHSSWHVVTFNGYQITNGQNVWNFNGETYYSTPLDEAITVFDTVAKAIDKGTISIQQVQRLLDEHKENSTNPHHVTAGQINAATTAQLNYTDTNLTYHKNNKNNPHAVTRMQLDADPIAKGVTGGSASAYTLAGSNFNLQDGALIRFRLHVDSGATPTINVNGKGARALMEDAYTPMKAGIKAGTWVTAVYSSVLNFFVLTGSGSKTKTLNNDAFASLINSEVILQAIPQE